MGKEEKCLKSLREFVNKKADEELENWCREEILKNAEKIEIKKLKKNKDKNNCYCCMFINTEECLSCVYNSPINK